MKHFRKIHQTDEELSTVQPTELLVNQIKVDIGQYVNNSPISLSLQVLVCYFSVKYKKDKVRMYHKCNYQTG